MTQKLVTCTVAPVKMPAGCESAIVSCPSIHGKNQK